MQRKHRKLVNNYADNKVKKHYARHLRDYFSWQLPSKKKLRGKAWWQQAGEAGGRGAEATVQPLAEVRASQASHLKAEHRPRVTPPAWDQSSLRSPERWKRVCSGQGELEYHDAEQAAARGYTHGTSSQEAWLSPGVLAEWSPSPPATCLSVWCHLQPARGQKAHWGLGMSSPKRSTSDRSQLPSPLSPQPPWWGAVGGGLVLPRGQSRESRASLLLYCSGLHKSALGWSMPRLVPELYKKQETRQEPPALPRDGITFICNRDSLSSVSLNTRLSFFCQYSFYLKS